MNKIFSKICLGLLIFSSVPMHGSGIFSVFQKYSTALWTSLYVLGSAVAVYACYKDVELKVKELENRGTSAQKDQTDTLKQKEINKPGELASTLMALGVMLKFFSNVE